MKHIVINNNDTKDYDRPVIEHIFGSYFHISTPGVTGVDMDNLFSPGPLHRHIMLSAFAEEH